MLDPHQCTHTYIHTYIEVLNELIHDTRGLGSAEADGDPLGLLQNERDVADHVDAAGQVVDSDSDVVSPRAQGRPQTLHLFTVLITILHKRDKRKTELAKRQVNNTQTD